MSVPTPLPMSIDLKMPDGRAMNFDVVVGAKRPTCFALGVRKSGSSIFSSIVNALAIHEDQANAVDIPGTMFKYGFRYRDWNSFDRLRDVLWRGNVYFGFRDAPTCLYGDPVFRQARKILVVRDPRDALVSEYFSNAYSHSVPVEGDTSVIVKEREAALQTEVEDYVLARTRPLDNTVAAYRVLLKEPNMKVFRYEDIIFDKASWIKQIAEHFELDAPDHLVKAIVGWADIRPEIEDKTAFVRRVAPGDHKNKLSPEGIRKVEAQLSGIWSELGYEMGNA